MCNFRVIVYIFVLFTHFTMDKFFPKEITLLIYEYKHSAEMYDISQEFNRWFEISTKYGEERACNLYGCAAFNFRRIGKAYYSSIFNIFQASLITRYCAKECL